MRSFIYSAIVVSLVVLQSCGGKQEKPAHETEEKQTATPTFKVATVVSDKPAFTVVLPGELKPYEEVSIYPKIKGFIKKIYVDRGSYVHKGQVLAQLEAPEIGEQYSARQSASGTAYQKYLFSKQSYNRLKEASKKNGAVATIELERAYAQLLGDSATYKSSRSEASASGQMNKYLRITAPFSGVITGRFISEGALVGDNASHEPLFQLAQQNRLRLTVAVPEKQAQALLPKTKATFSVVDYPGKKFNATLSRNSGALDVASRSVIAEFDIDNAGTELRAGQYAKVNIQLMRLQPTLWVPTTSIVQAQSGVFLIKVENNITRRIPVQTGVVKDTLTEVFGDLQAQDKILQKGSEEIKEGIQIKPAE
ncbi:efflux RND transporter periplasmic adaptor subunit [Segetibacter koreensis]|uniref:efflux RND transporter periplasmic adaptor subunit n=1 Tax=Segetibacter koreensis TaxID=398037 RepID=UPI0003687CC7|nr:efflux RND transporter periplasmic adaptor subunit [Segetibacter koreensis]